MFVELKDYIIEAGMVNIVVVPEGELLRVSVQAKVQENASAALFQPISVVGSAEQLDAELGGAILSYMAEREPIKNNLNDALGQLKLDAENAKKEAAEKAKKPVIASAKKDDKPTASVKPVEPAKPATASLFDMVTEAESPTMLNIGDDDGVSAEIEETKKHEELEEV